MYKTSDFNYQLPKELIAQHPTKKRVNSRLLILDKKSGEIRHNYFYNILNFFEKGDLLVLNNSKVFPARLFGKKDKTKGVVEVFLHKKKDNFNWECLLKGRIKIGLKIIISEKLQAIVEKNNEDGTWILSFNLKGSEFFNEIEKVGEMPLPPYIKRDKKLEIDKERYQTVFAEKNKIGSVAAPTAGLHFNEDLIKKLKEKGVIIKFITLHVGMGTFSPIKTDEIKEHKMHSEFLEISSDTIKSIIKAKNNKKRVVAVGTTSCRALESASDKILNFKKQDEKNIKAISFWTDIFIYPGYDFKIIDALITNFHLPKSTLLMLVSALAGKKYIDSAYKEAIEKKYRFFSYGDSMLII